MQKYLPYIVKGKVLKLLFKFSDYYFYLLHYSITLEAAYQIIHIATFETVDESNAFSNSLSLWL